jgi:hypothetical protein
MLGPRGVFLQNVLLTLTDTRHAAGYAVLCLDHRGKGFAMIPLISSVCCLDILAMTKTGLVDSVVFP